MYDLVPDSTFSFKRGGEKSSEKCASRPLCATTDSTGHASRCIVRSGVQRGGHPGPYGPIATISDPGPFPGEGKGLRLVPVDELLREVDSDAPAVVRPLCATTDSTGHASRCIVRSGVQRGGHPGPYGPIATISDPGPFPGKGKRVNPRVLTVNPGVNVISSRF